MQAAMLDTKFVSSYRRQRLLLRLYTTRVPSLQHSSTPFMLHVLICRYVKRYLMSGHKFPPKGHHRPGVRDDMGAKADGHPSQEGIMANRTDQRLGRTKTHGCGPSKWDTFL